MLDYIFYEQNDSDDEDADLLVRTICAKGLCCFMDLGRTGEPGSIFVQLG